MSDLLRRREVFRMNAHANEINTLSVCLLVFIFRYFLIQCNNLFENFVGTFDRYYGDSNP